jgi:cell division inhibitor SulA/protein ImuA
MPLAFDYRSISRSEAALQELLNKAGVRRGLSHVEPHLKGLPTGFAPLDELLPGGGLPEGVLTEITGAEGSGKLTLILGAARRVLAHKEPAALVDASRSVVPPVLAEPLFERLLVVRPTRVRDALTAVDALLRTRAFPLLMLDLALQAAALPAPALTRLVREAQTADTALVLLTDAASPPLASSRAALRLLVRRHRRGIQVSLVHSRLSAPGATALVAAEAFLEDSQTLSPLSPSPLDPISRRRSRPRILGARSKDDAGVVERYAEESEGAQQRRRDRIRRRGSSGGMP